MKKLLIAALTAAACCGAAQAAVSAGDVAVVAYRSDDADAFAWVALTDLAAGTTLRFTDSSWEGSAFRSGENGVISWTAASAVSAGTVVRWTAGSALWSDQSSATTSGTIAFALSGSGDQVFAFTGTFAAPSPVYGLQFAHATGIVAAPSVSNSTNTTNVPSTLSLAAGTMVNAGNFDNGFYNGPTTGTRLELLAAIANTANWVRSDLATDTSAAWATGFSVTAVPEPETYALLLAGLGAVGLMARRRKA